jgi:hypothetical protein
MVPEQLLGQGDCEFRSWGSAFKRNISAALRSVALANISESSAQKISHMGVGCGTRRA